MKGAREPMRKDAIGWITNEIFFGVKMEFRMVRNQQRASLQAHSREAMRRTMPHPRG
jgi:hypothetical protein